MTSQVKATIHGRPHKVIKRIEAMLKDGLKGRSRRQWGKDLAALICELADTNVAPENFVGHLPIRLVEAIARQRALNRLAACGMSTAA